jgi:sulfofructose kinase
VIESPAFQVVARDTTGAGDVFHAAFIWGLIQRMSERRILQVANAAAAMSCRALGAQGDLPTREELECFLREAKPRAGRRPAKLAGAAGDGV